MDKETYTLSVGTGIAYELALKGPVFWKRISPSFFVGTNVMTRKYFRLAL